LVRQVQISEGKWPSRLFWSHLAEQYGVVYKNMSVNGSIGVMAELGLLRGAKVSEADLRDLETVKQHVFDNFLQVSFLLQRAHAKNKDF
jgi:hypothetical protein